MHYDIDLLRKLDRVHPYPAKFPIDLAINYIDKYTEEGDSVFDPFVGSGTTLLAARVLKRHGFGTDINHIAILISVFKTLDLTQKDLAELKFFIDDFDSNSSQYIDETVRYNYPSIEHWFCDNAITVLSAIKNKISKIKIDSQKVFCNLVFSSIVNTVSNQESDTRYAAVEKPNLTITHITEVFIKKFNSVLTLLKDIAFEEDNAIQVKPFLQNAKKCDEVIKPNSIDLILTSPPYPNTYDYYLYHKHRMNWLGYDVKYSMEAEIGSRREFSSLKKPQEKFDDDLCDIFEACNKLLKNNGHVVIVMGDGRIQGKTYEAKTNIEKICSRLNWKLVDYSYTNLDDTSRSFQQSYRTKGKKEHVLTFKKEN